MHADDTLNQLDNLIRARSILRHPFYVAWQAGELTQGQLATYARVYWPHVAAFPGYLESVIEVTTDATSRATLEQNLDDERSNPEPHPELWLDFAEALGHSRRDVQQTRPHPAAERIVGSFTRFAKANTAAGVAALYAYEAQQPEVSAQKREGLRQLYAIDSQKALAYFDVHAEADVGHSRGERDILRRCLDDGAGPDVVLDAAAEALDAYWALLDGVCEEAGITGA